MMNKYVKRVLIAVAAAAVAFIGWYLYTLFGAITHMM